MTETLKRVLFDPTVSRILTVLIGALVIAALVRLVQRLATPRIRDTDVRYRVRKSLTFLGYLLVLVLIVAVYSQRLGGLTVALGVAGAGIAFALQEVIASVAGWVALTFSRWYAPGDRIQLGGIRGDVIDIGMLRTTLMEVGQWVDADLYNGRIVRIANSYVFKEPVFNYSGDFAFLWDEIRVPVKYGSDHQLARTVLSQIVQDVTGEYATVAKQAWTDMVRRYRIDAASVEPMVTLIATDNWLEFTLRYVVDYRRRRATKDELFLKILDAVERSGGRVALASTTVQLVEAPPLSVRLVGPQGNAGHG
jgi:small-conductance mechanosensitive channel